MNRMLKLSVGGALLVALVIVVVARAAEREDTKTLKGKDAPNFTLSTLDGKEVTLASQKGKVVVLDFWATWCPPCRASMPHLQKVASNKEFADKGLVVWAVNAREDKDKINDFLTKQNLTLNVPMDKDGGTMKSYLVLGIPTQVVVGRDGTVKAVFVGFNPTEGGKGLDEAVEAALAEKAPQTQPAK